MKIVDPDGHLFVLSYKVDQMDYSSGLSHNGAWTEADAVKEMEEDPRVVLGPLGPLRGPDSGHRAHRDAGDAFHRRVELPGLVQLSRAS